MVGNMFAGCEESPGEIEIYRNRAYKVYRGMGSIGAMKQGSSDRYMQVKEAGGVIVPHAHCRKDVEDIVRAAKFPPLGKRGYGGLCLSGQWGVRAGTDWMEWSNRETLVIPMIEDESALPNLEAILSTEGLDGVFFGPADFSISAGVPLQTSHEKVMTALRKTIEVADKYGKFVIFTAGFPQWETVFKLKELGVKAIELGHDVTILRGVWSRTLEEIRKPGFQR